MAKGYRNCSLEVCACSDSAPSGSFFFECFFMNAFEFHMVLVFDILNEREVAK